MEYHPYVLNHLDPVLAIQAEHHIVTQAYGPLTPVIRHPTGGPLKPVLEKIAKRLSKDTGKNVDSAVVLLQWTIQKGVVAVTTSGNPDNVRKMADGETFGQEGQLTAEEMKEIEDVGRKVHFRGYKVGYNSHKG
jgi:diketogulonate reductase-like aldo/keto reductase